MIAPHIICAQYAGFLLDQIFRFDEFGPSEKDSDAFAQASAREASKVEALPEARRGSGAVVEANASPDLLQYNSRDHEKKRDFFRAYLRAARPPYSSKGDSKERRRGLVWQQADGSLS